MDDERHLRRAIELAVHARERGQMPYGSLLVGPDGEVLNEDVNTVLHTGDITAHPELKLARWAARELTPEVAAQTTMYTSTHPCPMCMGAIKRSGLGRVVFALSPEQHAEIAGPGPDAREIPTDGPHLYDEASAAVEGFERQAGASLGPPSAEQLDRAVTALVPFVHAWKLPLNPEDLHELAYAVLVHHDSPESSETIEAAVRAQIDSRR